jgi:LmbE family N-acetylglucosaminyl deacetylase
VIVPSLERCGAYDSVFLSPHPDDVALSCPASLLSEADRGRRALVVTFFCDTGNDPDPRAAGSGARRRAEDAEAMARAGADVMFAGYADAPFRCGTYRSFGGIVFGRDPADDAVAARASDLIAWLLRRVRPDTLYAPLAVGGHIDHRLCHDAARAVRFGPTLFYEDRPYALVREAVRIRLGLLGARAAERDVGGGGAAAVGRSFLPSVLRAPYVRRYLVGRRETVACLARFLGQIARARRCERARRGVARATAVLRAFDPSVLDRCWHLASAYESQLGEWFGRRAEHDERSLEYASRIGVPGGHAERFWRL